MYKVSKAKKSCYRHFFHNMIYEYPNLKSLMNLQKKVLFSRTNLNVNSQERKSVREKIIPTTANFGFILQVAQKEI